MSATRGPVITGVDVTPVAIKDPPLLNASGVHEPFQLRSIIQIRTDAGVTGISEAYGDDVTLGQLRRVAAVLPGLDVFHLSELTRRVAVAQAVSAFEVACFDVQGKATGRRVVDLLGGAVRDSVDFSAYLFYKWAEHPGDYDADPWGAALDPDGIVEQAKRMVQWYGQSAWCSGTGSAP